MIQPINSTTKSYNLEPVKVPHFAGKAKASVSSNNAQTGDTVSFKQNAKGVFEAAKKGAKKGIQVIKHYAKKAYTFTKEFFKSIFKDANI